MTYGNTWSPGLDALLGGWQISGLVRLTSGFPGSVSNGYRWPTNWQLGGDAFVIGPIPAGRLKRGDGTVSMFTDQDKAIAAFDAPYPGDAGARNVYRGDGYASWDMSLAKRWKMPYGENHSVQFRWEVFNVPNLTRFDVQSNQPELDQVTAFGNYTGLLTPPTGHAVRPPLRVLRRVLGLRNSVSAPPGPGSGFKLRIPKTWHHAMPSFDWRWNLSAVAVVY